MMNKLQKNGLIVVIFMLFTTLVGLVSNIQAIPENSIPNVQESSILYDFDAQQQFDWTISRSLGIFAYNLYHADDQIRLTVREVDTDRELYLVNSSSKTWMNSTWVNNPLASDSSFYLVPRNWANFIVSQIEEESFEFWYFHPEILYNFFSLNGQIEINKTGQEILNDYNNQEGYWTNTYQNEVYLNELKDYTQLKLIESFTDFSDDTIFYHGKLMNVKIVKIWIDEKNYDIYTFSKTEGVLLSRQTSISIANGTGINRPLTGTFDVELTDYHGFNFKASPWHYVLWIGVAIVSLLCLIVVIAIAVNRRQKKIRDLEY